MNAAAATTRQTILDLCRAHSSACDAVYAAIDAAPVEEQAQLLSFLHLIQRFGTHWVCHRLFPAELVWS